MCGIFGVLLHDRDVVPDVDRVCRSIGSLNHRGPDGVGHYIGAGIALGHTRLALVDLTDRGAQPMWDESGRYCIVFNGEIYNFKSIRERLRSAGSVFRTETDTEVLLNSLIRNGVDETLQSIEGMYAFAFFDSKTGDLLLVRDRLGIKPLFVYEDENQFVFCSEIKAIAPWSDLRPNPLQVTSVLLGYGGPTRGSCMFENVQIVPPGTVISINAGRRSVSREFFTVSRLLDPHESNRLDSLSPAKVVDELEELLVHSVEKMLFADATVGVLCSGGVDSSLLLAIAARQRRDLEIFHADVIGRESEHDAASALARHLKLNLKKVDVCDQDFIDLLPVVTHHYGHPFHYHPNSVPFLKVARLVREHGVKAVLSGEGSDECFLGYATIAQEPMLQAYARLIRGMKALVNRLPVLGKYLSPLRQPGSPHMQAVLHQFERELEDARISRDWVAATGKNPDWNTRTLRWLSYHLRTTLHRNDCLGMAASIEARFPFLDEPVTRFAANLPHRYKIRFSPLTWEKSHPLLRDKWVMRMVADRYLPRELSRRKKMGFPVSAYQRLRVGSDYFRNSYIAEYLKLGSDALSHVLSVASHAEILRLLFIDVWGEVCLRGAPVEHVRLKLLNHTRIEPVG